MITEGAQGLAKVLEIVVFAIVVGLIKLRLVDWQDTKEDYDIDERGRE